VARVIKDYNRKKLAERKPQSPAQTRRAQSTNPRSLKLHPLPPAATNSQV